MTALSSDAEISPLESPGSADEFTASPLASPTDAGDTSLRSPLSPASVSNMTTSSTPLGNINAARRPPIAVRGPNAEIMAKLDALKLSRSNVPAQTGRSASTPMSPAPQSPGPAGNGFPAGFKLPAALQRPVFPVSTSSPAIVGAAKPQGRVLSLAEKRGVKMPGGLPGSTPQSPSMGPKKVRPSMKLSDMGEGATKDVNGDDRPAQKEKNKLQMYAEYIDADRGALTFKNKAVVHSNGVDFASGRSFSISLDEVDSLGELGKGNYGTVYKVRHSKPSFRQPGLGLARARRDQEEDGEGAAAPDLTPTKGTGTTGIIMAMKEMRLELEDTKFAQIIMELDILHRCISPFIVDFYGAFFQEGAIYICMEWMDGGSVDKLYADGVPENVLRKITYSTVMGLKGLKEGHNIIHRDVKPTNILINTRGQVKICDFGVSGNLVASIAKTNIGCQSYMAPERISGGGVAQAGANAAAGGTYSVQSDIWSLGLSIIECALGHYPYPPETYENIFSQLSAIVDGNPPDLPADQFSEAARDFVAGCLNKIPNLRPTYPMLLQHAWLAPLDKPATIAEEDEDAEGLETTESTHVNGNGTVPTPASSTAPNGEQFHDREVGEWVMQALDRRRKGLLGKSTRPALHAAPLDATFQAASKTTPPAPVSG